MILYANLVKESGMKESQVRYIIAPLRRSGEISPVYDRENRNKMSFSDADAVKIHAAIEANKQLRTEAAILAKSDAALRAKGGPMKPKEEENPQTRTDSGHSKDTNKSTQSPKASKEVPPKDEVKDVKALAEAKGPKKPDPPIEKKEDKKKDSGGLKKWWSDKTNRTLIYVVGAGLLLVGLWQAWKKKKEKEGWGSSVSVQETVKTPRRESPSSNLERMKDEYRVN